VSVHAFPAVELLWHQADRVVVRLGHYTTPPGPLGSSLGQTADVGSLDASAQEVHAGLLALHDARLIKRGSRLNASATVTEADLRAALPVLRSVTPVASSGGALTLQGTASLFGVTATVQAVLRADDGKLVVSPNVQFGGFATLTVFSNPRVRVQSVAASPAAGGFVVRGSALVR
jgi:hypothetical protein